jgi:hypothetical protein
VRSSTPTSGPRSCLPEQLDMGRAGLIEIEMKEVGFPAVALTLQTAIVGF